MIEVKQALLAALGDALREIAPGHAPALLAFESPKQASHGDLACTAAMQLARPLKKNPREVAQALAAALGRQPAVARWVESLDIAGPGFINLRLRPAARQTVVAEALRGGNRWGRSEAHAGSKAIVEFVSANPTGPLHVGHGRQAALGDALCNLLEAQGWQVTREFYYNDAGVQIATLAASVQARLRGLAPGDAGWPESAYNGDYIADIAADFAAGKGVSADDRAYTASGDADDLDGIRRFAVAYLRHEQDLDLRAFGVRFDSYFLESALYDEGRVEATVAALVASGRTYEADGALWLRSTDFGDDKDRVMRKSAAGGGAGGYTYFVPDVAYHVAKFERGFGRAVNIQGSDHHGTIARVRAGLQALGLGIPEGFPEYLLHKMVTVMRGGQEVKISKRAGSYVTLRDLDRLDRPRRGALLPRQPQGRHRVRVRRRPGAEGERGQPRLLRAVRACAHLLGAGAAPGPRRGRRRGARRACRPVAARRADRGGADAQAGRLPRRAGARRRRPRAARRGVLPARAVRRLPQLLRRRALPGRRRRGAHHGPAGAARGDPAGARQRAGDARRRRARVDGARSRRAGRGGGGMTRAAGGRSARRGGQRGGFFLGVVVGLLTGLALALGVALYVTKVPVPFLDKVPQRGADQDAAESERNRNWNPNAPLAGRNPARPAPAPSPAAPAPLPPPPSGTGAGSRRAARVGRAAPGGRRAGAAAASVAQRRGGVGGRRRAARRARPRRAAVGTRRARPAAGDRRDPPRRRPPPAPTSTPTSCRPARTRAARKPSSSARRLGLAGLAARVTEREQAGRTVYRVRLGPYQRKEDADSARQRLETEGVEAALVRVQR